MYMKMEKKNSHQSSGPYIKDREISNCSKGNSKVIYIVREMPKVINK